MVNRISENVERIREKIEAAASISGRSASDVRLVAVSKTRSVDEMLEVCRCDIDALGENRVQEALLKHRDWPLDFSIPWHLIGHLQSNKARKAVETFSCIESVDSLSLAKELHRISYSKGKPLDIMVEVNIGGDPDKFGVTAEALPFLVETILLDCTSLSLQGFMTVLPLGLDEPGSRSLFAQLRDLRDDMEKRFKRRFRDLSMGMSGDFEYAVMEGSSVVRIGTAIFGERDH